jgi:hypothetical protein
MLATSIYTYSHTEALLVNALIATCCRCTQTTLYAYAATNHIIQLHAACVHTYYTYDNLHTYYTNYTILYYIINSITRVNRARPTTSTDWNVYTRYYYACI